MMLIIPPRHIKGKCCCRIVRKSLLSAMLGDITTVYQMSPQWPIRITGYLLKLSYQTRISGWWAKLSHEITLTFIITVQLVCNHITTSLQSTWQIARRYQNKWRVLARSQMRGQSTARPCSAYFLGRKKPFPGVEVLCKYLINGESRRSPFCRWRSAVFRLSWSYGISSCPGL